MADLPDEMRAAMNCGLMPVERRVGGSVWGSQHGMDLQVCAGFTTELPEVVDIALHYQHFKHGTLAVSLAGAVAPNPLIDGVTILEAAINEKQWRDHEEATRKGGR
jgi:hypothetical protein